VNRKTLFRTALALSLVTALSIGANMAPAQDSGRVEITGDVFEIDEVARKATFTGGVVVKQVNFTLWAPRVIALYGQSGTSDLKEVTADGGIRIEQPDQTATSDYGIYDPKTKILRMIGNVQTTQKANGDVVNSAEMVVDLKNDTTRFVGADGQSGRVTAVFGSGN